MKKEKEKQNIEKLFIDSVLSELYRKYEWPNIEEKKIKEKNTKDYTFSFYIDKDGKKKPGVSVVSNNTTLNGILAESKLSPFDNINFDDIKEYIWKEEWNDGIII
jgi:hypothetical protein